MLMLSLVGVASADAGPLRVFLPRTAEVTSDALTLGQVAIVHSPDHALRDRAEAVPLGRGPFSGEEMRIDRRTVLARLASSGIEARAVELTGSAETHIRRQEQTVPAADLLEAAETLLAEQPAGAEGTAWHQRGEVGDLRIPAVGDVELDVRLAESTPDRAVVEVAAVTGDRTVGTVAITFRRAYARRRAVATRSIAAGALITGEMLRIETVFEDRPPRQVFSSPVGLIATHALPAGAEIRPDLLRAARREILVRRGQSVLMRIEGNGFTITGLGEALQDARCDEFVKVRNADSGRVVIGRVEPDGAVYPVYRRVHP